MSQEKNYLRAGDAISGQEGWATAVVDGVVQELFMIKDCTMTFKKRKKEFRALGFRGAQHKTSGWTGTGEFTLYYVSSYFRKLMREYAKTGQDLYFTITIKNNDPTSTVGTQVCAFYYCNIDEGVLAKVDVESEVLEESMTCTFSDFEYLDYFVEPTVE